jgi:hypothetical protein
MNSKIFVLEHIFPIRKPAEQDAYRLLECYVTAYVAQFFNLFFTFFVIFLVYEHYILYL